MFISISRRSGFSKQLKDYGKKNNIRYSRKIFREPGVNMNKKRLLFLFFMVPVILYSENLDYRQQMRDFAIELRIYADSWTDGFIIIPQNGQELITANGEPDGVVQFDYLAAIDGTGREDLFYGYSNDDEQTPDGDRQYLFDLCRLFEQNGIDVLVTDYCSTHSHIDGSYRRNLQAGFISFAADRRELDKIPSYPEAPYNANNNDIARLGDARNFLYLINGDNYPSKTDFIKAVSETDYDLLIIDIFHDGKAWSSGEVEQFKQKAGGGRRLVISYMSIGEAEDYRYYWSSLWEYDKPHWMAGENPDWDGNYKVRYWDPEWKRIIYGNNNSYLKKIIDAGFDGVYLDIIDAFEYFE